MCAAGEFAFSHALVIGKMERSADEQRYVRLNQPALTSLFIRGSPWFLYGGVAGADAPLPFMFDDVNRLLVALRISSAKMYLIVSDRGEQLARC